MVSEFKEATRILKWTVERSKDEKWREFCAALDQDPWERLYRVIRAKMDRNVPSEGLSKDRVARILNDLFVINKTEQSEGRG